ncbi:MAG TPA: ABC-F family ATP-binding cassette domain-containing protein [Eubacteriales bacterium]|nr:ABC-F family ATP-binding cassette domain-containing protein [Eubacteriales bacterium]
MLIQITNGTFFYNEKKVFEDVSLQINENDKIGFVGRNGEGKTTLIHALIKDYALRDGEVSHKSNLRIGYLKQNSGLDSDKTVYDEMNSVFAEVHEAERAMRQLENEISVLDHNSEEYRQKLNRYNAKNAFFEANDGYNIEVKIKTILNGMGFTDRYNQVINTMSGGEKTRLAICRLLLTQPELLIMDEPTNHLDFTTLQWLEGYLASYKGALLLVSHDRYFLDKLVNKIWEIENFTVTEFTGNYSKFKQLKEAALLRSQQEYERQQNKIASMLDYAQRNIARASTSNSAKSRLKQVANMEKIDKPYVERRVPRFDFTFETPSLKTPITVKNLTLKGGERLLLEDVSLEITRGDKVALIGPNGAGKSTFIKKVVKAVNDDYASVRLCQGVVLAYYDQENLNFNPEDTVLQAVWEKHYRLTQTYVRKVLAQALLSQEDIDKKVRQLSGGERAKLGLAMMVIEKGNTLVMDEPTNHLDLTSRESLEESLADFSGTVLFVSHDRYFINKIATKIVEIENKKFNVYKGNFDDYIAENQLLKTQETQTVETPVVVKKQTTAYLNPKERKALANAKIKHKELEKEIEELEKKQSVLEEEISSNEVASDYKLLSQKCSELAELKKQTDSLIAEWEKLAELLI